MKKILRFSFACCCLFVMAHAVAVPSFNLSAEKKTLRSYHDSGAYNYEITEMIANAKKYLDFRLSQIPLNERNKMAIVYDIDETSLSNYPRMLKNDFGAPPSYIFQTLNGDFALPIYPTLSLYRAAQAAGLAQFFITGREENLKSATIRNLNEAGYANWQGLYLEPVGSHFKTAADFKARVRKKLIDQGYDIILSIGDQCSDLADSTLLGTSADDQIQLPAPCGGQHGAYEDHAIKLPNPYYFIG